MRLSVRFFAVDLKRASRLSFIFARCLYFYLYPKRSKLSLLFSLLLLLTPQQPVSVALVFLPLSRADYIVLLLTRLRRNLINAVSRQRVVCYWPPWNRYDITSATWGYRWHHPERGGAPSHSPTEAMYKHNVRLVEKVEYEHQLPDILKQSIAKHHCLFPADHDALAAFHLLLILSGIALSHLWLAHSISYQNRNIDAAFHLRSSRAVEALPSVRYSKEAYIVLLGACPQVHMLVPILYVQYNHGRLHNVPFCSLTFSYDQQTMYDMVTDEETSLACRSEKFIYLCTSELFDACRWRTPHSTLVACLALSFHVRCVGSASDARYLYKPPKPTSP